MCIYGKLNRFTRSVKDTVVIEDVLSVAAKDRSKAIDKLERTRNHWSSFSRKPREAPAGIATRRVVTCKQIRNYKSSLFSQPSRKEIQCVYHVRAGLNMVY